MTQRRAARLGLVFLVTGGLFGLVGLLPDGGSVTASIPASAPGAEKTFATFVTGSGQISRPQDLRRNPDWQHIGSWAVVNPSGEGNGLHDVYTTPDVVAAYRETGAFPDGAMLVKEVRSAATESLTTGQAYWADQPQVWFVMVKDRENRFPDNPLWGRGWGWALFKADNPAQQVASNYETDCLGCHVPAAADDWVYTRAYPDLSGAH